MTGKRKKKAGPLSFPHLLDHCCHSVPALESETNRRLSDSHQTWLKFSQLCFCTSSSPFLPAPALSGSRGQQVKQVPPEWGLSLSLCPLLSLLSAPSFSFIVTSHISAAANGSRSACVPILLWARWDRAEVTHLVQPQGSQRSAPSCSSAAPSETCTRTYSCRCADVEPEAAQLSREASAPVSCRAAPLGGSLVMSTFKQPQTEESCLRLC